MGLTEWSRVLAALDQLPNALTRLAILEERMTTAENVIARLDAVTTAMANDIGVVRQKIIDLQNAITSGNQAAVSAAMDSLAPSIETLETTEANLKSLGSDPNEPVPASIPDTPTETSTSSA